MRRTLICSESHPPVAELAFQDGGLVAQGENLGVPVEPTHRQQTNGGEQIHDRENAGAGCGYGYASRKSPR
jgi:hypothetical protein